MSSVGQRDLGWQVRGPPCTPQGELMQLISASGASQTRLSLQVSPEATEDRLSGQLFDLFVKKV